jgi:predicted O-linked N-acetylglucosamine transferase (SPINDLY family)
MFSSVLYLGIQVAKDTADYVRIAVKFGTDKTEQARVRNLIKANAKKLFHRSEAVSAWTHLLQEMAYNGTELGKRTDHSAKLSDIKKNES